MRNYWEVENGFNLNDQSQISCPQPCYKRNSLDLGNCEQDQNHIRKERQVKKIKRDILWKPNIELLLLIQFESIETCHSKLRPKRIFA